jgi:hypothetical protein
MKHLLTCSTYRFFFFKSKIDMVWAFTHFSHVYCFHFIMLIYESAQLDGMPDACPGGLCEKPSASFRGGCMLEKPCIKVCRREGWPTGFCKSG